ncbi:MAG: sigma 54-interacting transcriptional regulator [Trichlorobacter sp.]|uniref:sigma-54-dependent transcriptional regulator n=1 Tax=Trichlorobacter sp. TaxID=2911007 RepID=UPI0025659E89|nr:sigma 54-interacting transcriptional regulator [Trichlorobacter sp.]
MEQGKAHGLRGYSPYKKLKQNWMSVACGQFTSELMRSELFGHVKGAFTGATSDKPGLLKRMDKDTLFLDEIGDIDTDTQRLLIKALEEQKFQPLGSERTEKSDFRLITATNRTLDFLRTKIHEDFFDRISPLVLEIPSLQDIPEDIPWIWRDVYNRALSRSMVNHQKPEFSSVNHAGIVNYLQCHSLPGNYRDLYRIAYRLIAFLNDLDATDNVEDAMSYALASLNSSENKQTATSISSLPKLGDGFSIDAYISGVRSSLFLKALEQSSGNQREAASLLGISPQAINKFKKTK